MSRKRTKKPESRTALQVEVSFWRAINVPITIFLAALLMIPGQMLLNKVFDHTWEAPIRVPLLIAGVVSLFWFVLSFFSSFADLRSEDARDEQPNPVFGAEHFYKWIYGGLFALSVAMMIGTRREGDSIGWQLIPTIFIVLVWYAWPRPIQLEADKLTQRNRWGRMTSLPYAAIQDVTFVSGSDGGSTIVAGENCKIVHTGQHADKALFHVILEERSGKRVYGV
ncbi:MAG TPA: hypothetical protein VFI72_04465 [Candidatus Angelobacter sp.]|nr:hypothetical protein [Candidatus Angelobacter sp.]